MYLYYSVYFYFYFYFYFSIYFKTWKIINKNLTYLLDKYLDY